MTIELTIMNAGADDTIVFHHAVTSNASDINCFPLIGVKLHIIQTTNFNKQQTCEINETFRFAVHCKEVFHAIQKTRKK